LCMMSGYQPRAGGISDWTSSKGGPAPLRFNEPVSNWSFEERQPTTPRWPKAAAAVELGLVCPPAMPWPLASSFNAWPSMGLSPRAQSSSPRPSPRMLFDDVATPRAQSSSPRPSPRLAASPRSSSTPRPSPRQYCDVVMTVKNTFINMAIGRPLSMDDFLPERAAMSCPATARRPMSSRGGEGNDTMLASAFDKLESALIEEATSPTNSATEADDAPADLDNDACSSAASALPRMEDDTSPVASAYEAEDVSSNLDPALSAETNSEDVSSNLDASLSGETKAEPVILTPLRLPIPHRDGHEPLSPASRQPLSPASSSSSDDEAEADYGSASATVFTTPSRKQVLRLGDGLIQLPPLPQQQQPQQHQAQRQQRRQPKLGSNELPTVGSAGHHLGGCKPCAFAHTKGCENGVNCNFCHLCEPGEKKRRQKRRMMAVACQVESRLKEQHQAAAATATTAMSPVMCRPMMSSPVVSRPVMVPTTANWVASPGACSPGGVSSTGSNAWPVGSPTTSHCASGGTWPVAASPSTNNTVGGWQQQSPQLRMAAVFSIY